jgi:hypothetical protein
LQWGETESTCYVGHYLDVVPALDDRSWVSGMKVGRGNWSTRGKRTAVPLWPPKIRPDLTWPGIKPRPPWWETGSGD